MRWLWKIEPRGFLKLLGPLVARLGRRQERMIWTGLKQLLKRSQLLAFRRGDRAEGSLRSAPIGTRTARRKRRGGLEPFGESSPHELR